jgi:hypothetical protein
VRNWCDNSGKKAEVGESLFETLRSRLKGRVTADELLCWHTTWRVGGPADLFIVPADGADLVTVLRLLAEAGVPWVVIGAGSNLLVRDGGVRSATRSSNGWAASTRAGWTTPPRSSTGWCSTTSSSSSSPGSPRTTSTDGRQPAPPSRPCIIFDRLSSIDC